jgi:hypothetical protein
VAPCFAALASPVITINTSARGDQSQSALKRPLVDSTERFAHEVTVPPAPETSDHVAPSAQSYGDARVMSGPRAGATSLMDVDGRRLILSDSDAAWPEATV